MKNFTNIKSLILAIALFSVSLIANFFIFYSNNQDIENNRKLMIEAMAISNLNTELTILLNRAANNKDKSINQRLFSKKRFFKNDF